MVNKNSSRKYFLGFALLLITVFGFAFRSDIISEIELLYKQPTTAVNSNYEISKEEFLINVIDKSKCIRLGGDDAIAIWDTSSNQLKTAYFYLDNNQLSEFNARKLNSLSASMLAEKVNMLNWISNPKGLKYFNLELEQGFVQGIGREWFENLSLWVQKFGAITLELTPIYGQNFKISSLIITCTRNTPEGVLARKWRLPNTLSSQHINELIVSRPSNLITKKWLNQWPIHPKKYELRISRWNYN